MNLYSYMSDLEAARASKFISKHYHKGISDNICYIIHSGHIGDGLSIKCKKCNKKKDITDYGCW